MSKKPKVLTEEEWMESIRGVIQRDYFPLPFDHYPTTASSTLPSLDKFLQANTSEDNEAFAALQHSQAREFETKFPSRKPQQLALQNGNTAHLLLTDKEQQRPKREINAKAVQALYPYTQSIPPPPPSAATTVAYKQQQQRKKPAPALSQQSLALVAKLRQRANN